MQRPTLTLIEQPSEEQRSAILGGLAKFNAKHGGPPAMRPLCVAIYGPDGEITAGLYGKTIYDWLAVELLFVSEELRATGIGSALLARAEEEAKARGCIGAWLDTFSFQARGFYEKQGYAVVGTIPDHPRSGARYFLSKRWAD